jgi:hypothetical protein
LALTDCGAGIDLAGTSSGATPAGAAVSGDMVPSLLRQPLL